MRGAGATFVYRSRDLLRAEPGASPTSVPALRRLRLVPLGLGIVGCLVYATAEVKLGGGPGWPLDDAWIHAEFARHLAAGEGLAFAAGDRVAGSTAPLWTALVSLGFTFGLSPLVWTKLVGVGCFLLAVVAARRLAETLGLAPGLAVLAAALTAATGWLVWGALSGLEIPLFLSLSLAGIERHVRERGGERLPLAPAILALAALARPEGLLLLALAAFDGAFATRGPASRRALAGGLALAAAVLTPPALAYTVIGGSPLPTTFAAKAGGVARLLPEGRHLYAALGVLFRASPFLTLAAGAGVLRLAERLGTSEDRGLLPALWLVGLPVAQSLLAAPAGSLLGNFGRYLFPLLPLAVILGLLGCQGLVERVSAVIRRRLVLAALAAALLVPAGIELVRVGGRFAQSVRNVQESDVAMAHWLAARLPAGAVLAAHDVGALGYFLDNPLIDLAGILDGRARAAMTAAEAAGSDWQEGLLAFLGERRPDYLVVFPRFLPFLERPDSSFRLLEDLPIADNITMGDDRLGLYATPWCRFPLRAGGAD